MDPTTLPSWPRYAAAVTGLAQAQTNDAASRAAAAAAADALVKANANVLATSDALVAAQAELASAGDALVTETQAAIDQARQALAV